MVYVNTMRLGSGSVEELLAAGEVFAKQHPDFYQQEVDKGHTDDVAAMFFTSGTTGNPKGCGAYPQLIDQPCPSGCQL